MGAAASDTTGDTTSAAGSSAGAGSGVGSASAATGSIVSGVGSVPRLASNSDRYASSAFFRDAPIFRAPISSKSSAVASVHAATLLSLPANDDHATVRLPSGLRRSTLPISALLRTKAGTPSSDGAGATCTGSATTALSGVAIAAASAGVRAIWLTLRRGIVISSPVSSRTVTRLGVVPMICPGESTPVIVTRAPRSVSSTSGPVKICGYFSFRYGYSPLFTRSIRSVASAGSPSVPARCASKITASWVSAPHVTVPSLRRPVAILGVTSASTYWPRALAAASRRWPFCTRSVPSPSSKTVIGGACRASSSHCAYTFASTSRPSRALSTRCSVGVRVVGSSTRNCAIV